MTSLPLQSMTDRVAVCREWDIPAGLGRSFRVKLWPTLVFMRDGREVARLVRPADAASISRALADIGSAA